MSFGRHVVLKLRLRRRRAKVARRKLLRAVVQNVYKRVYTPERIQKLMYSNSPLLRLVPKVLDNSKNVDILRRS